MLRRLICLAVLFTLILPAAVLGEGIAPAALEKAKGLLHQQVDNGAIAGGAHLVVQHGKVVLFEVSGLSDVEKKTPFQADTIVRIYSMTKPITSVAAMTLFEQGKFQLDDPVAKYIPAFEKTGVLLKQGDAYQVMPAKRQITVRDLFRHTAGYSYGRDNPEVERRHREERLLYRPPSRMMPPQMTIAEAAEALARIPALHHPGERFTYGYNTDLLGRLIEVWSGKPLDESMQQAIFDPLKMVDTGFSVPKSKRGRFASCHGRKEGKRIVVDRANESEFNDGFKFLSGGGGLVSTMGDYANFCRMIIDGGTFEGRRVLKESTVKLMLTDQLNGAAGDFRFGLGFAIGDVALGTGEEQRRVKSYSWGGYASTAFRIVPEAGLFQIVLRQSVPSEGATANRLFAIVQAGVRNQQRER